MRDHIRLLINNQPHEIRGADAFKTLGDYVRYDAAATGTKIVCAEGDCGACTVLIRRHGEFSAVNSCIQAIGQLDGASIVTVEGMSTRGEKASSTGGAVQESMIACHGAQCGYCTPGFVVAMTALFENQDRVDEAEVRNGLTGNLCRCTGYEPIIKAACAIDASSLGRMRDAYATLPDDGQSVAIDTGGRRFFAPATLDEALAIRRDHPGCTIVQGGTDVGVWVNKRGWSAPALMNLAKIRSLEELREESGAIVAGANVSLSRFESFIAGRIPELHSILRIFGSPQIRNAGTLVGNIANGSPIGDTIPYLFVNGAVLELQSTRGQREVTVGSFYLGYRKFDLAPDEIITRVRIPIVTTASNASGLHEVVKLYKVSRRRDLDISAFTAAIRLQVNDTRIASATIAYGGVGPVVLRLPATEAFLREKEITLAVFRAAGALARGEITPISDVRGSRDYRLQLAENIMSKFFFDAFSPVRGPGPSGPHGLDAPAGSLHRSSV